jgi:hypothetical protein
MFFFFILLSKNHRIRTRLIAIDLKRWGQLIYILSSWKQTFLMLLTIANHWCYSPLLNAKTEASTTGYWQYIVWSICGGICLISVPSSCSILYLQKNKKTLTKLGNSRKIDAKFKWNCVRQRKKCIQVKPVLISDQIHS